MSTGDLALDNPFWTFSSRFYRTEGVAPACLELQERYGVDVNLLLFCLWIGAERGVRLTQADLAGAEGAIADWHVLVVQALRGARQWMKNQPITVWSEAGVLRESIKREELAAERIEQAMLHAWGQKHLPEAHSPDDAARRAAATDNFALFLAAFGAGAETDARDCLLKSLDASGAMRESATVDAPLHTPRMFTPRSPT
jgi:uncharacterized protein (TIGR02444 family)